MLNVDLFGMDFRRDPQAHYPAIIAASPAFAMVEGTPSVIVAGFEQTAAVIRDYKTYASARPANLPGMQKFDFFNGMPVMNYADPPDHTRRRRVASPAFSPKRIQSLIEGTRPAIAELVDKAALSRNFDAVADITRPMAIDALMVRFLNIEPDAIPIFLRFSSTFALLDGLGPDDPKPRAYLEAWEAGAGYCRRAAQQAQAEKGDNLIGAIASTVEGGVLSDDEMMAMMVVLMSGGLSTASAGAAMALYHLAQHPAIAERIRRQPELAAQHFEETLRRDSLVQFVIRFATTDTELDGLSIPKGTPVYALIAAACHDPAVFPEPSRFDIDRPNLKDHIAFGQGVHTCIGSTITRLLIPILIEAAARRMPRLHVQDMPHPVSWERRTARARLPERVLLAA